MKRSLELMQAEKMVIILKELDNIKRILDFFNGYNDGQGNKGDEQFESKPIKKNINYLQMDIRALENKIALIRDINKDLENNTLILFIIQYDYVRTQIEDMLRVIHALYNKMQQLFGETLNQYLPYPVLGRRFSNNGIMMYLNNYYREMLKNFSLGDETESKLILNWNYRTGFQYRIFINRELKREHYNEETFNNYIDLPYWYNELPMLLPAITHEVALISLRKPSKKVEKPFEDLKLQLNGLLKNPNNNFVQKVQDIIGYDEYSDDLAKVVMSDVMGYRTDNASYIHALFHNMLGEKLAKEYLKIIHGTEKESFKIIPNEWYFGQIKDHSILRLHFLLFLFSHEEKENQKSDSTRRDYRHMKKILNAVMPLDDINSIHQGFSEIYKYNYPNFYSSYRSVQIYLAELFEVLVNWYTQNYTAIKNIPTIEKAPNFSRLWEERYKAQEKSKNLVLHQNNFRREIHRNKDVSGIEFLENSSESIIYILELGKARKDINSNRKKEDRVNIMDAIDHKLKKDNNSDDTIGKVKKFTVYGIYDWVTIKEKKAEFNIIKKLDDLLDSSNTEDKENFDRLDLKYFKTKQVLMKINKSIENNNYKEDNKEKFSVIFNIELKKKIDKDQCSNGYSDLKGSINNIAEKLADKENLKNFKIANIYKSLGPKDLTVIIEEATLSFIFNFLSQLNKQDDEKHKGVVLRTFTMICSQFGTSPILEENFSIVSYLRISNKFKNQNTDEIINTYKDRMKRFHEITGVMDFRIEWRKRCSIQEVLEFYNKMIHHEYLTDFQTKIERDILLE